MVRRAVVSRWLGEVGQGIRRASNGRRGLPALEVPMPRPFDEEEAYGQVRTRSWEALDLGRAREKVLVTSVGSIERRTA